MTSGSSGIPRNMSLPITASYIYPATIIRPAVAKPAFHMKLANNEYEHNYVIFNE